MSIDRRTVLLGLGSAALTGCAAPGSAVYQIIDSYRALERGKKNYPFTRTEIENEPTGVLGVQVEDGLKGVMVWSKRENGLDHWRSGNGVVIVTQAGRLIRTSGFPQDQLASRLLSGNDPLGLPLDPARSYEQRRELDFLPDQYGVEAIYSLDFVGNTEVQWLDRKYPVSEWAETVRVPNLRRKWKQLIQVDPVSGTVLRSVQHVGPRMRVILELLKPPVI